MSRTLKWWRHEHMQLIEGSGWKANFDDERNLYTARTSVPGAIKLFEITKG